MAQYQAPVPVQAAPMQAAPSPSAAPPHVAVGQQGTALDFGGYASANPPVMLFSPEKITISLSYTYLRCLCNVIFMLSQSGGIVPQWMPITK